MLRVESVSKTYRPPPGLLRPLVRPATGDSVPALRDVSLTVGPGQTVGLVGPNGAGKTTLLKIVGGLLDPDEGRATVDGIDISAHRMQARRLIGLVLTEERGLYWRLTARQNLELFGVLGGLSHPAARASAGQMLDKVGLRDSDQLVFGYSSGMRAKLNLARALLTDAGLLVLDEPTRSLDPMVSSDMATMLRGLAAEGRSILLSSHRMEEVAHLCDRVVILVQGRVRYEGSLPDGAGQAELAALLRTVVAGT
jgi:ABC-type multidrug transport system ATPase subunit